MTPFRILVPAFCFIAGFSFLATPMVSEAQASKKSKATATATVPLARLKSVTTTVQTVALNLHEPLTSKSTAVTRLSEMRAALESGKIDQCLSKATQAKRLAKSLEPWILNLELQCALKLSQVRATSDRLNKILLETEVKPQFFVAGPWQTALKKSAAQARLLAVEVDLKFNRARAWTHVEKLSNVLAGVPSAQAPLNESDRAKLWRLAGELLFLEQKNEGAREFFRRSLQEQEQPDLRERWRALTAQAPVEANASPPLSATAKQPDGSEREIELYDRISESLKGGDLVAAASDAVRLMNDFSGSPRAKWAADRTQESLISVSERSGAKFIPVREALLKSMESADADRLAEWSRVLFNRGLWAESARLGRAAISKPGGNRATRTLEIAMDASYAIDDFKSVNAIGSELVEKHAGTASARTAALRMGLAAFRLQEFSQSAALFEKLISTPSTETLELQARYWLWRSLERLKNERATAEAEELSRRFPFSYYGLRARLELNGGTIDWSQENEKTNPKTDRIENKIWVTQQEKLGFDRALVLVSAGWFDEAQEELSLLPPPMSPDAKAVRARLWAAARNFLLASKLANEAWDAKFELRRPELMSVVWPNEHRDIFEAAARAKSVDAVLLRSLTKQESGFNRTAVSSSGALGLMQMIPPTAREIADDLKLGRLTLPTDLFQPERNIKMGTHYVAKMLTQFKGHVPLALAAYNNGPTRVERWMKGRPSLTGLEASRSSAPESEIWFDEFPFNETSFYVKAILRNQMLYQIVENGRLMAQEPLWKSPSAVAGPSSSPVN